MKSAVNLLPVQTQDLEPTPVRVTMGILETERFVKVRKYFNKGKIANNYFSSFIFYFRV